jgi:GH15 family glucan-1,4-alpha-glucosidase
MEITRTLGWLLENWDQPDEGIWETRGGRRDYTYSRLMSWVAVERAIRIAHQRGLPADIARWSEVRDRIYRQIMERGWHAGRRAFVQHFDTDVLDASLLLMPLCKFIAPTDPRWISTLDAMTAELVSDSLVYRYNVDASPDGLAGKEATFSMCCSGGSRHSPAPGDSTRRGSHSRRCSHTRTTSACTRRRSDRPASRRQLPPSLHAPRVNQRGLQPRSRPRVNPLGPEPTA